MGNFRLRVLLALASFACVLNWSGCSSNSTLAITLSPAGTTAVTIKQGATQIITASLANDPSGQGVTWSLSGGGSLANPTKTSVTYEAPAGLASNITATVTATSVANTSITATLSITVDAVLTITTTSLPAGALDVHYFGVVSSTGSTSGPFTWVQKSGSLPAGLSLSSSVTDSIVISGIPTTLGSSTFTLQITDSTGEVASQSFTITINPPPPLSVATRSLSAGTVSVAYNQTLQASSGTAPYTWAITAGTNGCVGGGDPCLPAGLSLNTSTGLISGIPTTAGSTSFTVQVTDSSVPQQMASANLSITINPNVSNNTELNGNYAFLVSGSSPNGHFAAAGSFVADGAGNISNGVMDTNDPDPAGPQLGQTFTGTYAIGTNNLGTMSVNTLPVRSFAFAMMANGNAKIIEFDDQHGTGTRNSGVLLRQTTSAFSQAQISGNYAFGFSGSDAVAARYGLAGAMFADGAGHFTSGVLDSNDAGVAQNQVAFTGTFSSVDPASGHGTATISIAAQGTTSYSFYVVSSTQLLMMEIDFISGQGSPIVSGSVLQQAVPFGASSLSGTSVLQASAISGSGGGAVAQSQVGLFTGDGGGNFTVNTDENTGSTMSSPSCLGTYSNIGVSTGRTDLTYSGPACAENVIYLVSTNQGFVMGTDANVTFGFMENQSGSFTNASLSGNYAGGSLAAVLPGGITQVDLGIADGVSAVSFTTDSSTSSGLIQNQTSSGSYAVLVSPSGKGTITVPGGQAEIFYMVSPTEFISLFSKGMSGANDVDATLESFQQ